MSMQALVMSNPTVARYFMSHAPGSIHERSGRSLAKRALRHALERTSAYPAFLREHGIDPARASVMPFEALPIMSRREYVDRYPLEALVRDGKFTTGYTIERSSGYSGETHYWFRTPEEDAMFPEYMEFALREFFRVSEGSTLVIVAFALGAWTGGEKFAQCMRTIAAKGTIPMSVMSPGNDLEDILQIVADISPRFTQTLMFAYPPFAKAIIDEGAARGIDWGAVNLRLGVGGEGFTEAWRRHVTERLGCDPKRDLLAITGGYGAADLGLAIGREYPLSILVRQLCSDDSSLAHDLFGGEAVPNLFQYSPSSCYAEERDGELVFTVDSGIPLVRYRIRDRGGVIPFEHVIEVLHDHAYDPYARLADLGYDHEAVWRLPFFHCLGRSDGAVLLAGLMVYSENVAAAVDALDDPDITGFKMATARSADGLGDRLLVMIEHRKASLHGTERGWLASKYGPLIADGLARVNREYRNLRGASSALAEPVVKVYPAGCGPFAEDAGRIKRRYVTEPSAEVRVHS